MKSDGIAFGIAGVAFGLLAGWIIASQTASYSNPPAPAATQASAPAPSQGQAPPAAVLDEAKVNAFKSMIDREPANVTPRAQLANLYFDAERYDDAIKWYTEALKLAPDDVNVSTDLGVCYYYTNQNDKALDQFAYSLKRDPKHAKTLLNQGIVLAFGKQDLEGAARVWQQVIDVAPESTEAQGAKRALDSLRSAHPS